MGSDLVYLRWKRLENGKLTLLQADEARTWQVCGAVIPTERGTWIGWTSLQISEVHGKTEAECAERLITEISKTNKIGNVT